MYKPEPLGAREGHVKEFMQEFKEKHINPAVEKVRVNPDSLDQEADGLFRRAKDHFKAGGWGRPGYKEALYLFARERLDDLVRDRVAADRILEDWQRRRSSTRLARLILYPLNPWRKYGHAWSPERNETVRSPVPQPGFIDYARSLADSSYFNEGQPDPPPPLDPVEQDLETNVRRAEEDLERHKAVLRTYRVDKEKAGQEQAQREREVREKAEQEVRDRMARERAEREARDRAQRKQREREQSAQRAQSLPQWAMILELKPPYTEEKIRSAYRAKAKLTHPDRGGTAKEFREIDSAFDAAMAFYRSQRSPAV